MGTSKATRQMKRDEAQARKVKCDNRTATERLELIASRPGSSLRETDRLMGVR